MGDVVILLLNLVSVFFHCERLLIVCRTYNIATAYCLSLSPWLGMFLSV